MLGIEMNSEVEGENFAEELSDEALDRDNEGAKYPCGFGACACVSCGR